MLTFYHLIFDKLLRDTETTVSYSRPAEPDQRPCERDATAVQRGQGHGAEGAALRNLGYLSVAAKLIDPNFNVPAEVQAEVNTDLLRLQHTLLWALRL